ncbi:hypothetical protein OIU85_004038 [Salix viminalis]|uniref:DUF4283 domain-containing protein n=1 Tax=Salix viminalis TaxID=40686 RepID=A0A9Q0PRQ9_SALVM|nr:hypothetical protein OIU85_004038 [Salix viminalis]
MVISSKPKMYSRADKVKITEASTRFTTPSLELKQATSLKSRPTCSQRTPSNGTDQMHAILERGPWMFGGKTMILQQWHPQFIFDKNRISKLPVWIRLHGLPFSLWSRKGLSAVASMVGRPLSCDESTFCCTRLDYARVCVELDASLPLVTKFDIKTDLFKEPLHLEVEYEWQPPRCGKCHLFGHVCSEDKGNTVTKPAENGNLVPALDGRNLHERDERQPPRQPSLGQKPQDNKQPQKTHTKITQDSNSTSLSQTIVHHKKGRIEEDSTMEQKNQETTPTSKEDEERVRKGKMQVEVFPIGTVNESVSLQSKETYVEEEVSEATTTSGGNTEDGDWSPFIKLELDKWNVISNASETKAARIIIGWDHEIYNVQCIHSNPQWMTCSVTSIQPGLDIVVTFVYGANTPVERQDVWNYLQVQYRGFQRQPWVLMGDFNATLRASDRGSSTLGTMVKGRIT